MARCSLSWWAASPWQGLGLDELDQLSFYLLNLASFSEMIFEVLKTFFFYPSEPLQLSVMQ